jgi:hypothetical protein
VRARSRTASAAADPQFARLLDRLMIACIPPREGFAKYPRRHDLLGFYFLLSLIAFGVIARWFIQNDKLAPGEHTIGILRMKDAIPNDTAPIGKVKQSADMLK